MTIKDYCAIHNITYTVLAERLCISKPYISKLLYNKIIPSEAVQEKLLSIGIDEFPNAFSEPKYKKDECIHQLEKENYQLRIENKLLREKLQTSIDKALDKLVAKELNKYRRNKNDFI